MLKNPNICGFTIKLLNKIWGKKQEYNEEKIKGNLKKKNNSILVSSLTESQTSSLISRCRREGVRVHSAICTAFLAAQAKIQKKKSFFRKVNTAVSLRNRLTKDIGDAFGLYASESAIKLKYSPNNEFWEMARVFQKKITRETEDKKVISRILYSKLLNSNACDKLIIKVAQMKKIRSGYSITNLGLLNIPIEYGPLKLEAFYGPSVYVNFSEKTLGVITVGGKMFFTLTYHDSIIDSNIMEKIKDSAIKQLCDAIVL